MYTSVDGIGISIIRRDFFKYLERNFEKSVRQVSTSLDMDINIRWN